MVYKRGSDYIFYIRCYYFLHFLEDSSFVFMYIIISITSVLLSHVIINMGVLQSASFHTEYQKYTLSSAI